MQRSTLAKLRHVFLGATLLVAPAAWSDCVDTVGLTPQERDFYLRANAVLKSLLRPPPSADKLWSSDSVTDPSQIEVCKSDKKIGNFTVAVSRKYVWPDPKGNMADSVVTLYLSINADKLDLKEPNYSGAYGNPSPARSAGLKVYNVVWSLSGSSWGVASQIETLRASLADGLDRERMEKLVGRPLPTAAESDALAKKAPPTKLLASAPALAAPTASTPAPSQTQPVTNNADPVAPIAPVAGYTAPEVPTPAPSPTPVPAVNTVKELGDSIQKLRSLFGK